MRAYIGITAGIFGLVTVAHLWRLIAEPRLARAPWYLALTVLSATLFLWGLRLLWPRPKC